MYDQWSTFTVQKPPNVWLGDAGTVKDEFKQPNPELNPTGCNQYQEIQR